jgi:hypothetical protein
MHQVSLGPQAVSRTSSNMCADVEGCKTGVLALCGVGFVVCFIAASVPCYIMCCCVDPPAKEARLL